MTDQAPTYPLVLDALLPAVWHRTDRYANNTIEADHSLGTAALGLENRLAAVLGVVVAVVWNLGLSLYAARASRREFESHPAISPSPEAR